MSRHTPGDWKAYEQGPHGFEIRALRHEGRGTVHIAQLPGRGASDYAEADSRLIAASPGLYDACQAVVDAWEEQNDGQVVPGHVQACMDEIRKARST